MKEMYKKGGAKKKKKYSNGGPTPSGISNFYGKVDSFLDAALPGRQKRQDMRAERKERRQAVRQENALKKIEAKRMSKGGSVQWTRNNSRGRGRCM